MSRAAHCLLFLAIVAPLSGAERVDFQREVRPLLSDRCFPCHGPDAARRKADLRLDTREGAEHVLVAGKPGEKNDLISRLVDSDPTKRMPPAKSGKTLSPAEIDLVRRWVAEGGRYEPHWSYAPVKTPGIPRVNQTSWPRGTLDQFILARLEAEGKQPVAEADPPTLLRRLCFDLTGLPPAPEQRRAFLENPAPEAYPRLVDSLLASPAYGERLATWWLDLVRYADTVGYHGDQEHQASPYRDYVIASFQANKPFDRFTIEQLAGDLLGEKTEELKIATCYNRLLQTTHEGGAQDKEYRAKYLADRVRNLSAVWLGATVGCAECHNHKFDPYTMRDFYGLGAFFADVQEFGAFRGPDASPTLRPPEVEVVDAAGRKRKTMTTVSVTPRAVRILKRGDWMDETGEIVDPGTPPFLPPLGVEGRRATRLDLARWLTRPDHPQTSRVVVNRLWALFFGAGLSRSLEDGGAQGEGPTHPELLDHLSQAFVASGWDLKSLIRTLVLSSTYRQSSRPLHEGADPENRLVGRQGRFRLPAEMIRDNALSLSGLLVTRLGGRPVRPYQPDGYYAHLNFPKRTYHADRDENQYRRAVYVHWQRQYLHPMFKAFDAPSREECTASRPTSNTPLAALTLLNDPSFTEAARAFAVRILHEGGADPLGWAWRTTLTREPLAAERAALGRLLEESRVQYRLQPEAAKALIAVGLAPVPPGDTTELAAWTTVARALLNLHETITRE